MSLNPYLDNLIALATNTEIAAGQENKFQHEVGGRDAVQHLIAALLGELAALVGTGAGPSGGDALLVSDAGIAPASNAAAVTPGAGALAATTRALFVGTGGDVTVTMEGSGSVVFTNVPDGTVLPIKVTHVTAATASDIVALW
jgi:hypothetical protein